MICNDCRYKNPPENRFCGMCGALLLPAGRKASASGWEGSRTTEYGRNPDTAPEGPAVISEPPGAVNPSPLRATQPSAPPPAPQAPVTAATPRRPPQAADAADIRLAAAAALRDREPAPQSRRETRVSGPSFLGLNESEDDPRQSAGADEYYAEEGSGTNWMARVLIVLVILAGVAGLFFLQWRSSQNLTASPAASTLSDPNASTAKNPEARKEQQIASAAQAETESGQAPAASSPENSSEQNPAKQPEAKSSPQPGATPSAGDGASDRPPASAAASSAPKNDESAPDESGAGDEGQRAASKGSPAATAEGAAAASADNSQAPVQQAEAFMQRDPQDCDQALSILRAAANRGNTPAEIKLGAMYATGNCVGVDRVEAYRHISRAMESRPNNTWLTRNRSMIWSQMTASERQQVGEAR